MIEGLIFVRRNANFAMRKDDKFIQLLPSLGVSSLDLKAGSNVGLFL
jgi:hypothetical protein